MAEIFQNVLLKKFWCCFRNKSHKACKEDKGFISVALKKLDKKVNRDFSKHKKSEKWKNLKEDFEENVI